MAFEFDLGPKVFKRVLLGLTKKTIYGEAEVTHALITEQLLAGSRLSASGIGGLLNGMEALITKSAHEDWSIADLSAQLDRVGLDNDLKSVWADFWRAQRDKVHAHLVEASAWTDTIKRLAWRVDVVTSSKESKEIAEPTAIMELRTGRRTAETASDVVVFEMNRAQLSKMLGDVERIEAVIAKHSGDDS